MKKISKILLMCLVMFCLLVGCGNRDYDYISIYNKSSFIFDDVEIPVKEGYFYKKHEKFTVDENTIGVTIYFSNEEDSGWE